MIEQIFSEKEYRKQFHDRLTDPKARAFSKKSMDFHREFYSFSKRPVFVSRTPEGEVGGVLFVSFTRDGYVSVINLLTDPNVRRGGHARKLMAAAVAIGWKMKCRRLRMNCEDNPSTIGFYNSLGFVYLGVTKSGCLYCNVPLTSGNLSEQSWFGVPVSEIVGEDDRVKNLIRRRVDWETSKTYEVPDYVTAKRYLNRGAKKSCAE